MTSPPPTFRLDGRRALVTGAGRGIGLAAAQALAEAFMGDSIVSNILCLGFAWQRGLVPVGLAALLRAIELNGVAVENNQLAFALGRLAAADPQAELAQRAQRPGPAHPVDGEAVVALEAAQRGLGLDALDLGVQPAGAQMGQQDLVVEGRVLQMQQAQRAVQGLEVDGGHGRDGGGRRGRT